MKRKDLCRTTVDTLKKQLFLLALLFAVSTVHAEEITDETVSTENTSRLTYYSEATSAKNDSTKAPKKGFVDKLPQPFRWIIRNWAASDERYALSSFYNWAVQLQNSTTFEWVNLQMPQGVDLKMRSKVSNRLGPYFGWRFLFFGSTIDLTTIGKGDSKRKDEFTLSINSALFNIDLIRRRTGGDFILQNLDYDDEHYGNVDLKEILNLKNADLGDYVKNSLTGININYFVNHLRYSNPAAFTNGAIQLRSVGTPIVGIGYTRQQVETEAATLFGTIGLGMLKDNNGQNMVDENRYHELEQLSEQNPDQYRQELTGILRTGWRNLQGAENEKSVKNFLTNRLPSVTTVDDWHIQLGYAYNIVFSRRLLMGLSAILSPGVKHVRSNNDESYVAQEAQVFCDIINEVENRNVPAKPEDFHYRFCDTHFNLNAYLKASLVFTYDRWRAGINTWFSDYFYKHKGMTVNNRFGNVDVYVGYCFGRKKEYRPKGELRKEYLMATLTPRQITEMHDTMPKSNIDLGSSYLESLGKTPRYHTDKIKMDINGCELVCGPEGKYGWFEIADGYVTPRQDTDSRLKKGTKLEVDKDGCIEIEAGHKSSFRTGNWWKTQLDMNQISNQQYSERLHYALGGKLTLYLRGNIFNSEEPVKLELNDFYINHGKEKKSFYQVGVKSFASRTPNSIEGETTINGHRYRICFEQKKRNKPTKMFVSLIE